MKQRHVIVGAGIIGAALAAHLADSDTSVTVVEADQPGRGTSGSSLAWANANGKPPRAYHDLNVAGIRAWREWAERLGGDWFRQGGGLHWADPAEAEKLAAHVAMLAEWDYPARLLTPTEALHLEPDLAIPAEVREVAYFPEEAYLLTVPAVQALLDYATARGVTLVTGDAVAELLATGDRVHGVRLASGTVIEADTVALCAGWHTPSSPRSWASTSRSSPSMRRAPARPASLPGATQRRSGSRATSRLLTLTCGPPSMVVSCSRRAI
ncbi:MAG TPA: FAD-dependent oxidoreductase [Ktedonobacterales bacterium]